MYNKNQSIPVHLLSIYYSHGEANPFETPDGEGRDKYPQIKRHTEGSSLVALLLGFWAFTVVAWVQSLVGELRSRKFRGAAKKKDKWKHMAIEAVMI